MTTTRTKKSKQIKSKETPSASQEPPTLSPNFDDVAEQVAQSTPYTIIELIARQLDRADEAKGRIDREGSVVRDTKGSVIAHPAIQIELAATKLAAALIEKHKA